MPRLVCQARTSASFSSLSTPDSKGPAAASRKTLVTGEEGVHQTMRISQKNWKQKPLFRRQGDVRFKTGMEASRLLVQEAIRRDAAEPHFITSVQSVFLDCLSPIFDRNPKYAFIAKALLEPERYIQFRVSWIDDTGVVRLNRGYRIQYSSSLGPYFGTLHFGSHINNSTMKAIAFDTIFSNALTGYSLGAAVGGADINTFDKSEGEIQRFCQSYMTECAKYIGPGADIPIMGMGCSTTEMGYLFGQYKRIASSSPFSSTGANNNLFLSSSFHEVSHGPGSAWWMSILF
jgi:glutamate dehydrogenase (NADP+)